MVSKFIPIASLKEEKFEKILNLEENRDTSNSIGKNGDLNKNKKYHLVYYEKYENIVDKYLEKNRNKKKCIKNDIFNRKNIINQYQYDIFKMKNKILQNNYEIDFLNVKKENLAITIEENKI